MRKTNPFPARLKEARKNACISQKDLGIRLGMDQSSASSRMNHYEKGRHMPDIQTIRRLAEELNVPVAYFFCDSDKFAEIICLIEKLSEKQRHSLLDDLKKMMGDTGS